MGGLKGARIRLPPVAVPVSRSAAGLALRRTEASSRGSARNPPPPSLAPAEMLRRARRLGWSPERIVRREGGSPGPNPILSPPEVTAETEVPFRFDADEDGIEEPKRMYVRKREDGAGYEAIVNTDPVPLVRFVTRKFSADAQLAGWVQDVTDELTSSTIGESRGRRLRQLFLRIVQRIYALRGKPRDTTHFRPPTVIQQATPGQIQDPASGDQETTTQYLEVDPLSIVPPQDATWTGYGVKDPNTQYMVGLKQQGNYVRGHLLNSKLHGPGIDRNLVPISQTLNSTMRTAFEDDLKVRINQNLGVVRYRIAADYSRPPLDASGNPYTAQDRFGALPGKISVSIEPYTFQKGGDKGNLANWQRGGAVYNQTLTHYLSFTPRKTTPKLNDKTEIFHLQPAAIYIFPREAELLEPGDVASLTQRGFGLVGAHNYRRTFVGRATEREKLLFGNNTRIYTANPATGIGFVQGNSLNIVPKKRSTWVGTLSQQANHPSLTLALGNARTTLGNLSRILATANNVGDVALPILEGEAAAMIPSDPQLQAEIQGRLAAIRLGAQNLESRTVKFRDVTERMESHIHAIEMLQLRLQFPDTGTTGSAGDVFQEMLEIDEQAKEVTDLLSEISFSRTHIQWALDQSYANQTARTWTERLQELQQAGRAPEIREAFAFLDRLYPTQPEPMEQ